MTVRELMHRWTLACANKPLFYLPFHRNLGKVVIEPMTHIFPVIYDYKQFFVPYCNKSQLTGTIRVWKTIGGKEQEPTLGCEYRIYKRFKKASGGYEYISVLDSGVLDRDEKAEMFKNKTEITLPEGVYYYKEFISGEGDVLHFNIERFEVKANEITHLVVDHEPKLVQTYFKFVKKIERFELAFNGDYSRTIDSWSPHVLFAKEKVKKFKVGNPHNMTTKERKYKLIYGDNGYDTYPLGEIQEIRESPNEKIIPEFTDVLYMGESFGNHLNKKKAYDYTERYVYFNLNEQRYIGTSSFGDRNFYEEHYKDYFKVFLLGTNENPEYYLKCNPDWYYDDILIHTGHLMLYTDCQIISKNANNQNLYNSENYSKKSDSVQINSGNRETYQGFYISVNTPNKPLRIPRDHPLEIDYYYGFFGVPDVRCIDQTYANDTIYTLEIESVEFKTIFISERYKNNSDDDYAYWFCTDKQESYQYYCEKCHKYETEYYIGTKDSPLPQPDKITRTETKHGGGKAKGYAAAEDIGGASMWICKAVSAADPDTNGGYSPPYSAPDIGLYFTITQYFYADETYETVTRGYSASTDLLFPNISPHVYKQKKGELDYSGLEKHKNCVGACNCAVVFVRQTREHYREWFNVEEPDDWEMITNEETVQTES